MTCCTSLPITGFWLLLCNWGEYAAQKGPPDHQHPMGRLGIQTLRWGGGGTADILIYNRLSILRAPSCRLWVILQLGLAQQGPRVPCPLPHHVHFIYPDPCHSSRLLAMQPHRGSVTHSPPGIGCQPSSLLNDSTSRAGTGHAIPPHLPISTAILARHGGDVT